MRHTCIFLVITLFAISFAAKIDIENSVVMEGTKRAEPASKSKIDAAFVRGELRLDSKTDNELSGLLHLRFQANLGSDTIISTLRQVFLKINVWFLALQAGRWYESYTPGMYFGRYLFGVRSSGSGSMATNYTVIDGLRLQIPIQTVPNTDFIIAILPQQYSFENVYTLFLFTTNVVPVLKFNAGADIKVLSQSGRLRDHRFSTTVSYDLAKDLQIFLEYGNVNLSHFRENSWILAGVNVPSGKILDLLRVEFEYGKRRIDNESDFAWIIATTKEWGKLIFYLNFGSDPAQLNSQKTSEMGVVFRVSATF